jgi:plastocyanin
VRIRHVLPAAIAAAALLAPTAAQAATKTVYAGPPPRGALSGVPPTTTDNAFYPAKVKVHSGDSISYKFAGFHNVIFPPKGDPAPGFALIDASKPVSGATDAAGQPMWFNGQPSAAFNPIVAAPTGSKVINGKGTHGSGLPASEKFTYKVRFAKTGKFTYYCSIHPGMKGTVQVVKKSSRVPSKAADVKSRKKQARSAARLAKQLIADGDPGGNTVNVGNDKKGIASLTFFPASKTVKAGTAVTFQMPGSSTESHNVAFGPEAYVLSQTIEGPNGSLNPFVIYPSDPPTAPLPPLGTTNHGNGYQSTGLLDTDKASPFPNKQTITFSTPGTYVYYCNIHQPDMKGTIVVTS